ncbi:hypothetical protein [uncultured Polaribacter sp.]|nr:hypothetical protein [uncultured Polaribacter sp.]
MREKQHLTPVAYKAVNYDSISKEKKSWTHAIVAWFHNFLESAE